MSRYEEYLYRVQKLNDLALMESILGRCNGDCKRCEKYAAERMPGGYGLTCKAISHLFQVCLDGCENPKATLYQFIADEREWIRKDEKHG